ncbi:MAG: hypothetical protein Ta2E_01580 [Mycoplasmoidaceae bacterium]|nr:MAG: hypothetical protein Ta2E_01580 [Mycoplasmoidaceae bacterium]
MEEIERNDKLQHKISLTSIQNGKAVTQLAEGNEMLRRYIIERNKLIVANQTAGSVVNDISLQNAGRLLDLEDIISQVNTRVSLICSFINSHSPAYCKNEPIILIILLFSDWNKWLKHFWIE